MLRWLLASATALGAVALLPPTHARPPRRLQSAVATPELTKDEAGHLLGFGDASHEPSTLQQIDAACAARADALSTKDLEKLEAQIKAIDTELGPPVSPSGNVRRDSDGKDVVAVAAEFKRASPSKGDIALDADITDVASTYAKAGASIISVLTEPSKFSGSLDDLLEARRAAQKVAESTGKPRPALLRKDFVSRESQIVEARAYGADCILLIVACLTRTQLRDLVASCKKYHIQPLVEVHTIEEMMLALDTAGVEFIGINNRNLHSFKLDMSTTPRLMASAAKHPNYSEELTFASLSGAAGRSDVEELKGATRCVLVGEALMRAPDAGLLVSELRYPSSTIATKRVLAKVCGVTTKEDAVLACRAGADVIGVIHVPKSKRCVSSDQASEIVDAVRAFGEREQRWAPASHETLDDWADALRTATDRGRPLVFGVVQDQPLADVQKFVEESGVDVVQLHGSENREYAEALQVPHARVLHAEPSEDIDAAAADLAATYAQVASAKCCLVLVDAAAAGEKSGGRGAPFDWRVADVLDAKHNIRGLVAGGLDAERVVDCAAAVPNAVGFDASSRLESETRTKDLTRVRSYVAAAKGK